MRYSQAISNWLFERLRLDASLAGDLIEERERGRSVIWYWRQVLIAVCIGICGAIRDHKILALRAIATGCAANSLFLLLWRRFWNPFPYPWSMVSIAPWISGLSIILLTPLATGWIVARTHRAQPVPMVSVFAIWLLLWYVYGNFSMLGTLLVDSINQPQFRLYLAMYLAPEFLTIVGLLVGGMLGARPTQSLSARADPRRQ
jgi:hypothetical protein